MWYNLTIPHCRTDGLHLQAAAIGNACDAPLGIAASELQLRDRLYQGQQGTVSSGRWRGQEVAVKKARIGTSADMERFRMEIRLLQLAGRHENVVPLLAARALPPGEPSSCMEHSILAAYTRTAML